jgi:ARC6-like, IMS domain
MKYIFIYLFTPLLLWSCTVQQPSNPVSGGECPDKPTNALEAKNVETISVSNAVLPLSGNAHAGKDIGYSFEAQTGQKLSYQTQDNLCIWVVAPDTKVVTGGNLPQTGKYTLQVSVPTGAKTFKLDVTLGNLISTPPSTTPDLATSPAPDSTTSSLDQATAVQLINDWLNAKSKIFAAPFDRNLVSQYATGPLRNDITKTNGSIDWLQNNDSYYRYNDVKVSNVSNFSSSGTRPSIQLTIYEDRVLQGPRGVDSAQSGVSTKSFTYYFEQENGAWKIYDYQSN